MGNDNKKKQLSLEIQLNRKNKPNVTLQMLMNINTTNKMFQTFETILLQKK